MAVLTNLVCVLLVVRRRRVRDDLPALRRATRHVLATTAAIPFGVAAAWIGLVHFT